MIERCGASNLFVILRSNVKYDFWIGLACVGYGWNKYHYLNQVFMLLELTKWFNSK